MPLSRIPAVFCSAILEGYRKYLSSPLLETPCNQFPGFITVASCLECPFYSRPCVFAVCCYASICFTIFFSIPVYTLEKWPLYIIFSLRDLFLRLSHCWVVQLPWRSMAVPQHPWIIVAHPFARGHVRIYDIVVLGYLQVVEIVSVVDRVRDPRREELA